MSYNIEFTQYAEKYFASLLKKDKKMALQIIKKLTTYANSNSPRDFGKSLRGDRAGIWRYRVGDYRILCDIQDEKLIILVLELDLRKYIYK